MIMNLFDVIDDIPDLSDFYDLLDEDHLEKEIGQEDIEDAINILFNSGDESCPEE